jgi:phosphoribosylformylglycinamidine synthase subunit PurSL
VQGNTVVKPLVGPAGRGPSDAAVIEPIPGSRRGIALASGLATPLGDASLGGDPYQMALAGIDECVRNLVCAGADPGRIAILDNFCWPSCDLPHNMGALARACAGCYDGAMAYRTPFVSGKDSLNNQLRYEDPATGERKVIEIPFTLLITGLGLVRSIDRCVTMDAKTPGNLLVLVGRTTGDMGGSHYQRLFPGSPLLADAAAIPRVDLSVGPRTARAVAEAIAQGLVASAHDCSEGGVLTAVAEMLIATTGPGAGEGPSGGTSALADLLTRSPGSITPLGADLTLDDDLLDPAQAAFAQTHSRYVLEVAPANLAKLRTILTDAGGVFAQPIGTITSSGRLVWPQGDLDARVDDLAAAWRAPLDW